MNYFLTCKFGKKTLPLEVPNLRELTIVQDINKFLPEFRMKIVDATGALTHLSPIDNSMGKISIGFAQDTDRDMQNNMDFDAYMYLPEGRQSSPASMYDIEGLLSTSDLLTTDYSRSFNGTVGDTIAKIAKELNVDSVDISPSLSYVKNIVQPYWNNSQLLKYLKEKVIGHGGEWGFKCFIKCSENKKTLVFKSMTEMIGSNIAYKFILCDRAYKDQLPIYNYNIFGNSKIYTSFAAGVQNYTYFNYDTEVVEDKKVYADDFDSLAQYFLIESSDTVSSNYLNRLGRTNDFNADTRGTHFEGYVRNNYGNRLMDLVKLWITTQGVPNICPGQLVQVFFPYGQDSDQIASFQYSGYWLVERVVHNMGTHFLTKLLLTRNGIDTDLGSTLLSSLYYKV
jgi:hypothetical protein